MSQTAILILSDSQPDISAHPPHVSEKSPLASSSLCPLIFAWVFARTHTAHVVTGSRCNVYPKGALTVLATTPCIQPRVSERVLLCAPLPWLYLATRFASKPTEQSWDALVKISNQLQHIECAKTHVRHIIFSTREQRWASTFTLADGALWDSCEAFYHLVHYN